MPLIRGHHEFDEHFTQIPNAWLRDDRLSFRARGLLAHILSHRPEWSLTIEFLAGKNPEGRDAIRSAIKELEDLGYIRREQPNNGKFQETIWTTQDPTGMEPEPGNPLTENPPAENPLHKNTITKNTNIKNKEREHFDEFWELYPKKVDKAQALRAFYRALNRAGWEKILKGAKNYSTDPNLPDEKRFIKNPSTWLNADSWDNGPLPERTRRTKNQTDWESLAKWAQEQDRLMEDN